MVKLIFPDGEEIMEEDEFFETYEEAENMGLYYVGCCAEGAETLNMSNPGDYPLDDDYEDMINQIDIEVIEVDE